MSEAYFTLVTWPDGTEGLLFPRPGNVPINTTLEAGQADFKIAVRDLDQFVTFNPKFKGTVVRLVKFERLEVVDTYPAVEKFPPAVPGYTCGRCGRQKSHIHGQGYVCEYCAGIED